MNDKERQAATMALEALHAELEAGTCEEFENAAEKCYEAITALREALAEQAEQEPVAWMVTMENQDGTRKTFPLSGRYKDVRDTCDFGDPIPLYAAPVMTKDLTDDEICKANKTELPDCQDLVDFARAVIAADREKNKCQH